jgi:hypothetical protein
MCFPRDENKHWGEKWLKATTFHHIFSRAKLAFMSARRPQLLKLFNLAPPLFLFISLRNVRIHFHVSENIRLFPLRHICAEYKYRKVFYLILSCMRNTWNIKGEFVKIFTNERATILGCATFDCESSMYI